MKLNLPKKTFVLIVVLIGLILLVFLTQFLNSASTPSSSPQPPSPSVIAPESLVEAGHSEEIIEQKPWVALLPITNPDYYISYDFHSQTIKATVYVMSSFSFPKADQAKFLEEKVKAELQARGVDLNTEKIEWTVESTDE